MYAEWANDCRDASRKVVGGKDKCNRMQTKVVQRLCAEKVFAAVSCKKRHGARLGAYNIFIEIFSFPSAGKNINLWRLV